MSIEPRTAEWVPKRREPDIPVAEQHVHVWEPVGIVEHETVVYSPVSALDHAVVTQKLAVRSCSCGAVRRTEVGRKTRWKNR
jgi:hypothetical protein